MLQNRLLPSCPDTAPIPSWSRFRVGVPNELRKAIGKTEIIESLRTSDFREAKRLVVFESADTDARFITERRKLQHVEQSRIHVPALSDVACPCHEPGQVLTANLALRGKGICASVVISLA